MLAALSACVNAFGKYLEANSVKLGEPISKDRVLKKIVSQL